MQGPRMDDTRPNRPVRRSGPSRPGRDRRLIYAAALGVLAGVLLTSAITYTLWASGWFTTEGGACPSTTQVCPSTPGYLPVCATCGVTIITQLAPTWTPAPTETPNFAATATSACAAFQARFPATPCPTEPATSAP